LKCPYCGYYNDSLALKREEEKLEVLHDEHVKTMEEMPVELVKKNRRRMFALLALFVITAVIVIAAINIVSDITDKKEYNDMQAYLAKLEEMYSRGDYDDLFDAYYNNSRFHGSTFGKYENTADVANARYYAVKSLKDCYENKGDADDLAEALRKTFRCLKLAQNMREKGFIYGEKEAVESIEAEMLDTIRDTYDISDEDIEEGINAYQGYDSDYTEMAERILNGM
jgi:excinuclease UvrABC helicase subunit UvrB